MAGNQTVKDLDKKARLLSTSFEYFPVWHLKRRHPDGREEISLEPAAATSVTELRHLILPAGDLRKFDPSIDPDARPPTVPLHAALTWLEERQIPDEEIIERSLVHLPLYTVKYSFRNKTYTALVEAGTGSVFANIYPEKMEAPYLIAGSLTALVFLCLAAFPVIGALIDAEAFGISLLICVAAGILAAPALFALGAWVAAKI
jgi:hypothetical protein